LSDRPTARSAALDYDFGGIWTSFSSDATTESCFASQGSAPEAHKTLQSKPPLSQKPTRVQWLRSCSRTTLMPWQAAEPPNTAPPGSGYIANRRHGKYLICSAFNTRRQAAIRIAFYTSHQNYSCRHSWLDDHAFTQPGVKNQRRSSYGCFRLRRLVPLPPGGRAELPGRA
jgi:hypothetical protein